MPGQVCRYIGPITSLILEQSEAQDEDIGAYMEVNQRDLTASLHRMLSLENPYFINQFDSLLERKDVATRLLTPGTASQRKGGIL